MSTPVSASDPGSGALPDSVPADVLGVSLVERLFGRAGDQRPAYTHQDHLAGVEDTVTWAELVTRAGVVAAHLRRAAEPGDRIAIVAAQEIAYPVAFFGVLAAGMTAVPLMDPASRGLGRRLAGILEDCSASLVLTSRRVADRVREFVPAERLVVADELSGPPAEPVLPAPEAPAYLQYTSGSTRDPAGVVIPHRAVAAACWQASVAYAVGPDTTCAGWIPFFHDMGLVQLLCLPAFAGCRSVFMAPLEFVHRPQRWLRQLADYPDVFTAAPNFAFDLAAVEPPPDGLDLSRVRVALNGSEPVRPETVARFQEVFGPLGFRREAHRPSYGLAEATVYVTSAGEEGPVSAVFDRAKLAAGEAVETEGGQELVSVGRPVGQQVRTVADGRVVPDGTVGEVWVHGPHLGTGYWAREDDTFDAHLEGHGGWLRTGDLGVWHRGELYLTGRLKDVIVVDGRNYHPHDLEVTAEQAHPAVRRGRVAAFGVTGEAGEGAAVAAEWTGEANPTEVRRAVLRAVSGEYGLTLRDVRLVDPGALPRTSSGKVARAAARARYGDARG
ncbi:fatty acyl-AMP ligase [Amycolatopsis jiangsuensis]|uniref:Acyl-CoA synthetase (AMP-forming)/AMP-acid ligase II n=1 Tax=Amycolatopsis jiangsuensis TaxID=1181879 RepID=A0A840IQH9_9PSEU|nr:fatty acyl-AMP ligase [Amycolatopsis jiangsuensis]MBB4684150.1 acyl-CoA synthetase (AMP-forming)/AMP-acid ligase II [Amycolatopsis jiangsuensis]